MPLLRTLGSVAVVDRTGGGERHFDVQQKRLALLVFLARGGRGQYLRRDVLVSLFWPESDEPHGRGVLRQALTAFRKQLGPAVLVTRGEEEVGLSPDGLSCDATAFEAAYKAGEYEAACALYQGHFLEGFHASGVSAEFEQWVDVERDQLRRLGGDACWRMALELEKAGRSAAAVGRARRAVDLNPDDEKGVARLIAMLDRQGDRSGALNVYATLERRLAEGYSAQPAPETRALMKALRQRPTPASLRPSRDLTPPPVRATLPDTPSGSPPVISPTDVPPSPRSRRPLFIAGAIGALATIMLVALLGPTRPALPGASGSQALMAVVPFRVHAPDSSLSWLREGMVELLTMRLAGNEALRVVDPGIALAAWHRALPDAAAEASPDVLRRAAEEAGVTRIVQGSISGTPEHLILAAWVISMPDGQTESQASIEGGADSLPYLVDRLSGKLLGLTMGVEQHRLASLEGASPDAIRAFLAGRAAFRRGQPEEAAGYFRQALRIDSSFALAGLDLRRAAGWTGGRDDGVPGGRLARKYSNRLSAPDLALLDALQGQWTNAPGMFAVWNAAVTAYPERPETWYGLGDSYFHWGALAGFDDALVRAENAFRRGWALDSATSGAAAIAGPFVAEPLSHMVELAHLRGDTAEVLRLTTLALSADSSSALAVVLRWHRATMQGQQALDLFWRDADGVTQGSLKAMVGFLVWTGMVPAERARTALWDRWSRGMIPQMSSNMFSAFALNGGRPGEVPQSRPFPGYAERESVRRRLKEAAFWDGDSAIASAAARLLSTFADAPPISGAGARPQYQDICALGLWRAAHGDMIAATTASRRLRATRIPDLTGLDSVSFVQYREFCPAILDASVAVAEGAADARAKVTVADSLARTFIFEVCCGEAVIDANLILARLWEELGDHASALRAVRRRAGGYMLEPMFLSSFTREEGRLSALAGDTTGAIRAYRHYLALRPNPGPSAKAEVHQVEQTLAALDARSTLARAP